MSSDGSGVTEGLRIAVPFNVFHLHHVAIPTLLKLERCMETGYPAEIIVTNVRIGSRPAPPFSRGKENTGSPWLTFSTITSFKVKPGSVGFFLLQETKQAITKTSTINLKYRNKLSSPKVWIDLRTLPYFCRFYRSFQEFEKNDPDFRELLFLPKRFYNNSNLTLSRFC